MFRWGFPRPNPHGVGIHLDRNSNFPWIRHRSFFHCCILHNRRYPANIDVRDGISSFTNRTLQSNGHIYFPRPNDRRFNNVYGGIGNDGRSRMRRRTISILSCLLYRHQRHMSILVNFPRARHLMPNGGCCCGFENIFLLNMLPLMRTRKQSDHESQHNNHREEDGGPYNQVPMI
jgi:hypothetical protein